MESLVIPPEDSCGFHVFPEGMSHYWADGHLFVYFFPIIALSGSRKQELGVKHLLLHWGLCSPSIKISQKFIGLCPKCTKEGMR